jgi:hypothetical protein
MATPAWRAIDEARDVASRPLRGEARARDASAHKQVSSHSMNAQASSAVGDVSAPIASGIVFDRICSAAIALVSVVSTRNRQREMCATDYTGAPSCIHSGIAQTAQAARESGVGIDYIDSTATTGVFARR